MDKHQQNRTVKPLAGFVRGTRQRKSGSSLMDLIHATSAGMTTNQENTREWIQGEGNKIFYETAG